MVRVLWFELLCCPFNNSEGLSVLICCVFVVWSWGVTQGNNFNFDILIQNSLWFHSLVCCTVPYTALREYLSGSAREQLQFWYTLSESPVVLYFKLLCCPFNNSEGISFQFEQLLKVSLSRIYCSFVVWGWGQPKGTTPISIYAFKIFSGFVVWSVGLSL